MKKKILERELKKIASISGLPLFYVPVSMRVLRSLSMHWDRRSVAESGPMQLAANARR